MEKLHENFQSRLAGARVALDLTQQQLAESMEVSLRTIQNWESAESQPRARDIRKLAEILRVPLAYLSPEWAGGLATGPSSSHGETSSLKDEAPAYRQGGVAAEIQGHLDQFLAASTKDQFSFMTPAFKNLSFLPKGFWSRRWMAARTRSCLAQRSSFSAWASHCPGDQVAAMSSSSGSSRTRSRIVILWEEPACIARERAMQGQTKSVLVNNFAASVPGRRAPLADLPLALRERLSTRRITPIPETHSKHWIGESASEVVFLQ